MSVYCAVIDYGSGNLRSVSRALMHAARAVRPDLEIRVTDKPDIVAQAERIVLPGVGAFADCRRGLDALPGMVDAMTERVRRQGAPFLGICVGMQLLADVGREHGQTPGLGWIAGAVEGFTPEPELRIPHMGWDDLNAVADHPVLTDLEGAAVYYAHSYIFKPAHARHRLAHTPYGAGGFAAIVGHENILGFQFHPEKSQAVGLGALGRFLTWRPA